MKAQIIFTLLFIAGYWHQVKATHLVAANFEYEHIAGNDYLFKVYLYRYCTALSFPSSATLKVTNSCSSSPLPFITLPLDTVQTVTALPTSQTNCESGTTQGYDEWVYVDTVHLAGTCSDWHISYETCCRSNAISNLQNPSNQTFYFYTTVDNTAGINNSSPQFYIDPIFYGTLGSNFHVALGATDPDGDSLVFSLANPIVDTTTTLNFSTGLSANQPLEILSGTNLSFSNDLGQLYCTLSTNAQLAAFDIIVEEFRNGSKIAEHRRPILFRSIGTGNNTTTLPSINVINGGGLVNNSTIAYQNGQALNFTLLFSDADATDTLTYNGVLSSLSQTFPTAQITTSNPNGNSNELLVDITIPSPTNSTFMILLEENAFLQHSFTFKLQEAIINSNFPSTPTSNLRVFPNPMNITTTFDLGQTYQKSHIQLFNSTGQLIRSIPTNNSSRIQVNRKKLVAGLYFYRIYADGRFLGRGKLVVKE